MDAGTEAGDDTEVVGPETATPGVERKPAVTRRDEDADDEADSPGVLSRSEPPEPQAIDAENAAFVLLGVVLVIGFLLVAIAGL